MNGERILIVEDNLFNLELATDLLEANGFVVSSAQTAEEGLRIARELLPDLVLMDFGLPSMDGLCATKDLKANPATRHLTVVAFTAHAMKGDEEIAMNAGCDGHLTKPIATRTFVATIRGFIDSASLRRETTSAAGPLPRGTTSATCPAPPDAYSTGRACPPPVSRGGRQATNHPLEKKNHAE